MHRSRRCVFTIAQIFQRNHRFGASRSLHLFRPYAQKAQGDAKLDFPGTASATRFVSKLKMIDPETKDRIPIYRVLGQNGELINPDEDPKLSASTILKMYKTMTLINILDTFMFDVQNQGRVSFYMTQHGEEATVASAVALDDDDLIYSQYREPGVLMWRGFAVQQFINQCLGNAKDLGKGRMTPVHYGSRVHNFVTISSPLATQLPQAAGSAYAFKRKQNGKCVICFFGEGAASEGDAHAGLNFASVLNCPVIYYCRNNGYAISTPTDEQYRGDAIAVRGASYGMTAVRIDGNDVFAVYNATKKARRICVTENRPVLIEAITYRVGDHSSSIGSSAYRPQEEIVQWTKFNNPITRLKNYMVNSGLWNEEMDVQWNLEAQKTILDSFAAAESEKKGSPEWTFDDVYDEMPDLLRKQRDQMRAHVMRHKEHYPIGQYETWKP